MRSDGLDRRRETLALELVLIKFGAFFMGLKNDRDTREVSLKSHFECPLLVQRRDLNDRANNIQHVVDVVVVEQHPVRWELVASRLGRFSLALRGRFGNRCISAVFGGLGSLGGVVFADRSHAVLHRREGFQVIGIQGIANKRHVVDSSYPGIVSTPRPKVTPEIGNFRNANAF